jgi:hypothetical protein
MFVLLKYGIVQYDVLSWEPTNVDMCQFLSGLFFIRPIIILLLISNVIWTFSIIYIYKKCVSNSSVCSHIAQLSMTKPLLAHLRSIFRVKEILCTYKQVRIQGGVPGAPPLKLEKIRFFGVKSWFFTRNTSKMFAPPSARRNFLKCQ